ncbi:MAG: DUF4276 family protein [Planctomycetes bacterium]|nr:DUF4276 family protein [Planctomycetota bacterium]
MSIVRLHVVAEGQTEEAFVNRVLAPALWQHNVLPDARCVNTGKQRGGLVKYAHLRRDLTLWMKEDRKRDAWFTTMVDLFRLPPDFPGYQASRQCADPLVRAQHLEAELAKDFADARLLPYIQVHEFEALLFADPLKFSAAFPGRTSQIQSLLAVRRQFDSPEHIDEGDETAPSKRIQSVLPEYQKVAAGLLIASAVGIEVMRSECAHFAAWLKKLESLPVRAPQ